MSTRLQQYEKFGGFMQHLRLWESYETKKYKRYDNWDDFNETRYLNNPLQFTVDEWTKITDFLGIKRDESYGPPSGRDMSVYWYSYTDKKSIDDEPETLTLIIVKWTDDWWSVEYIRTKQREELYICDEWEGLLQLLNDLNLENIVSHKFKFEMPKDRVLNEGIFWVEDGDKYKRVPGRYEEIEKYFDSLPVQLFGPDEVSHIDEIMEGAEKQLFKKDYFQFRDRSYLSYFRPSEVEYNLFYIYHHELKPVISIIEISKRLDDWYFVTVRISKDKNQWFSLSGIWECDEFEGLESCLKAIQRELKTHQF